MQTKNPLHMWRHWRDKKGLVEALEDYYPDILASRPDLQMALVQMRSAEALINQEMEKLGEGDEH